jgi:hypothetical protein
MIKTDVQADFFVMDLFANGEITTKTRCTVNETTFRTELIEE